MGFLDLLGKKKDTSSAPVPPPAPGASVDKGSVPPKPGAGKSVPKPPVPGATSPNSASESSPEKEKDADDLEPPKPQKTQDPKAVFNAIHNQNPPPDFKPDEANVPKFDLPTFPKGYPELDFDIPTFGGKSKPIGTAGQPSAPIQEGKAGPQKAQVPPSGSEEPPKPSLGSEGSKDGNDDKFSTAIPGITPIDEDGNFETVAGSEKPTDLNTPNNKFESSVKEDVKPSFTPSHGLSDSTSKVDDRKHYEVEHDPFSPKENFLSKEERELNDEKEKIRLPRNEIGTDKNRIGNIESRLKTKTKVPGDPVFVEINDYKRALNGVEEIRRDLTDSEEMVQKLEEFNDKKHKEFERWKKAFQYIQTKLQHIDKVMFEPEEKAKK